VEHCIWVLVVRERSYLALEQRHIPAIAEGQGQAVRYTALVRLLFSGRTLKIRPDYLVVLDSCNWKTIM